MKVHLFVLEEVKVAASPGSKPEWDVTEVTEP
jgi:hypothetical protein